MNKKIIIVTAIICLIIGIIIGKINNNEKLESLPKPQVTEGQRPVLGNRRSVDVVGGDKPAAAKIHRRSRAELDRRGLRARRGLVRDRRVGVAFAVNDERVRVRRQKRSRRQCQNSNLHTPISEDEKFFANGKIVNKKTRSRRV